MEDIDRVSLLGEPMRRRLYEYAATAGDAVDRDQAAEAIGIGRPLAAFHLDRLVDGGLLEVEYRRRSGRTGPGAGRPAKFYRRPGGSQIDLSLPARRYALAAGILAEGLDRAAEPRTVASVQDAARTAGKRLAQSADATGSDRDRLMAVLTANGFEPFEEDGLIRLRNCPFDALVTEHRDLTCGLNLAFLGSVASTLGGAHLAARRQSRPGLCCVEFAPEP